MIPRQKVFDAYWRFAAERLAMYQRRLRDPSGPWTNDSILSDYRFTNTYRAADRVSQYLISEVQYRQDRPNSVEETFFRTLLFKIFNKIDTWELLERSLGLLEWRRIDLNEVEAVLDRALQQGKRIYSAAYIMPAPKFDRERKHANHLALIHSMMKKGLPRAIANADSLKSAYDKLLANPGLGPFLAFQYTIDLNYSTVLNFEEDDYVVAGPGALDGISKCFSDTRGASAEEIIHEMVRTQEDQFERLGLQFSGLFGRRMKPIDCQNIFCEISKYARVAFPDVGGVSGRQRIKQSYTHPLGALPPPIFPPKWHLKINPSEGLSRALVRRAQGALF
jgi:hypothetical protein